jgi:hypothetical protein
VDSFSHPPVDAPEILFHDVPERHRQEHARIHIPLAVDGHVGEPSHHATHLFRSLRVGDVVDKRVVTIPPPGVALDKELSSG